ncbi:monocarboxylate transporter 12-like [Patiria miniata]|uniref:Major facilitator superfamily (MFS) profile domain-containing protein n=1 Tax=Patiria miniata TaxID=46514 RepID=A0A914BSB9_PATMI|nr:monocarboxylate transporter 12-like [Patiria miniata]
MAMPVGQPPVSDGGFQGWIAVLTLLVRNMIWIGITKGLGVMLPTLQDQLASDTWVFGWIVAMVIAVSGVIAPFSGIVNRRFGVGFVIMTCGIMIGVAPIVGSFVKTTAQLAVVYMLLAGVGLGVSNVVAKEAVGRRFTKNYATASGIARTGYSIGLFVFAPLVQLLLNTYGWRGSMMLIGGICLHFAACGALLLTPRRVTQSTTTEYQSISDQGSNSETHQTNIALNCSGLRGILIRNFDLRLLVNARFWALTLLMCCTIFADDMWMIYFVSLAQSNGFSNEEAGLFVAIAGVGSLLAKVCQGPLTDRGVISCWSLTSIFIVIGSATYCATPWLTSYWAMMVSALIVLFSSGVITCQTDVLIKLVLGVELLSGAFAWIGLLTATFSFTMGFLPGLLYDLTGSYTAGFTMVGVVHALPIVPLALLRNFHDSAK